MNKTKLLALVLVVVMCVTMMASCSWFNKTPDNPDGPEAPTKKEYTYNSYTSSLGSNWNPHTWETSGDSSIASYLEIGFVNMQAKDTTNGIYQWVYEMATAITDVTATHQADLTKYNVTLPEGKTASEVTSGYVYEIKLNPNAKWQNGDIINADTYVYSMEKLLNSKMRNYRANLYYAGESAVAGGAGYFNSEAPLYNSWLKGAETYVSEYGVDAEGYATIVIDGEAKNLYVTFSGLVPFFGANSMNEYADAGYAGAGYFSVPVVEELDLENLPAYIEIDEEPVQAKDENGNPVVDAEGNPVYVQAKDENGELVFDEEGNPVYETVPVYYTNVYKKYASEEDSYGVIKVTPDMIEEFKGVALNFKDTNPVAWNEFFLVFTGYGEKVEWDTVGLYKVDDYTINYVCQTAIDINYFLTSCTSTWLVHPATYEASMKEEGGLTITKYGTSAETSMSYGPYMMTSFEDAKQVVFVQNPNWYGWQKDADGNLVSYTPYLVDGKNVQRYQTTKIVIDVMTNDVAYQKFLKGELMDYAPTPEELIEYTLSDRLTRVDETYTMSFFFNTDLETLKALDEGANKNSVVLYNYNFRKAFSLAFNRADFVTVTEGYTPAYALMNKLYHYDIYNDPTSSYRSSEPAMQAICNLYGVEYGADKIYKTLEEAYNSITGYNLDEAKALMKIACEELVAEGLYTAGEPITIQIGWKKGAMEAPDNAQVAKVQEYLNAAIAGSGFGAVTIEGIGSIEDRYGDVPAGKFAIGYGAWGGAAFYPFRNMQVYCDTKQYEINEAGCWDPAKTDLTINVNGEDVTMTWYEWSGSMIGTGKFANADNETKLKITAAMEEEFLKFYYRIPLCGSTICSLLSYKADYYTWDYNIMYGFGGLELMTYNYTDAEWAAYVASQNGTLNYK